MKSTFLTLAFTAIFGLAAISSTNTTYRTIVDCEHCAKDHKCDDKCKKGEKSECCEAAVKKNNEDKTKEASCCKKGEKSCKSDKKQKGNKKQQGQTE